MSKNAGELSWIVALGVSAVYWAATGSRWAALAAIFSYLVCTQGRWEDDGGPAREGRRN
jgi:hypothetical protein